MPKRNEPNKWSLLFYAMLGCAVFGSQPSFAGQAWLADMPYRVSLEVETGPCEQADRFATVELSFAGLPKTAGGQEPFAPECLRLVEVDGKGKLLDPAVVFQWDAASMQGVQGLDAGLLTWPIRARPGAGSSRRYHLYFSGRGRACDAAQFVPLVQVDDAGEYRGDRAWRIRTEAATYYYHRKGSGFASLLDREGKDWISYYPEGGPKGNYRGIPNIAPAGFHPGPGKGNKESRIVSSGPLRVRIISETEDEKWALFGYASEVLQKRQWVMMFLSTKNSRRGVKEKP